MGTRACIARKTTTGFTGVYHHWDGYPSGLGATLELIYKGHFKRDLGAMLKFLIDDHPAGWSTINGADFAQSAGFDEGGFRTTGPHCYCHGGRHETANELTEKNASECGCEYAYVFDSETNTMLVLSSTYKDGGKMVGMFGCGAESSKVYWKMLGTVKLGARKPNFDKMEKAA